MTGSGISSKEQHAVLSPSSAERWIQCPASVRMSMEVPPAPESDYALEGTAFHALAELAVRRAMGTLTAAQYTREHNAWRKNKRWAYLLNGSIEEEMAGHADDYVALVMRQAAVHPNTEIMLEQRVSTGIPSCWGTGDTVLVSPTHIEVIDAKYGSGVWVDVEGNPQLWLYGVGALEMYGDVLGDTETVTVTVFQPRMDNIASQVLDPIELRAWRDGLIPIAEIALGPDAPFNPSEEACRWCPAAGQCRAQMQWATAIDFDTDPDVLSPEEMAEALDRIPAILQWAEAVRTISLDHVYSKELPIPGWKVVLSGGRRFIADQDGALTALLEDGHDIDEVSVRKAKALGELETLLGKARFAELLAPYIDKTPGSPSLVKESDKRPAINANTEAQKEFEE